VANEPVKMDRNLGVFSEISIAIDFLIFNKSIETQEKEFGIWVST
jgi:hypothetical protein